MALSAPGIFKNKVDCIVINSSLVDVADISSSSRFLSNESLFKYFMTY